MGESHSRSPDVRQASVSDFEELKALLNAANDYSVAQSGHKQWHDMERVYRQLLGQIEANECFVIRNREGVITSAVALSEHTDYWDEATKGKPALYITKLMRSPVRTQSGEGARLMTFAATEAARRHIDLLRCDTAAELPGLIQYYARFGFETVGHFTYPTTGRDGVLLEAPIARAAAVAQDL